MSFTLADDPNGCPTIWDEQHEAVATLDNVILLGPDYRDLVWSVLTAVLAPTDEQIRQAAGDMCPNEGGCPGCRNHVETVIEWLATRTNGDGLDNRRANLRDATRAENGRNRRIGRDNTSGYKGADWHKRYRKWVARVSADGKRKHLGYYSTAEEAARAYDAAARELHGEYAALNFPRPGERPARTTSGAAGYPVVQGHCPACGLASLFLGSGGYVTCASLSCGDPTLATELLSKMPEPGLSS